MLSATKKENRKRVARLEGVVVSDRILRKGLLETSYRRSGMGSSLVVLPCRYTESPLMCWEGAGSVVYSASLLVHLGCDRHWCFFVLPSVGGTGWLERPELGNSLPQGG